MSGGRQIRCHTTLTTDFLLTIPNVTSVIENAGSTTITTHHAEQVVREMLLADPTLSGLEVASPALEDAFLALTKN